MVLDLKRRNRGNTVKTLPGVNLKDEHPLRINILRHIMDILYAVFLGFLQGATEFLPISSSGHLILAEHFFGVQEAGLTFDVRGRMPENIRVGAERQLLESAAIYSVVVPDFLASGGDEHIVFKGKPQIKTGSPLRELIVETLQQQKVISARTEGRICRIE